MVDWPALEGLVHRDPGGRGLASFRAAGSSLDVGQLRAAADHLALHATSVGIVTGFCAVAGNHVAAETDGPPGALFLARALTALGIDVSLITDSYALPLLKVGCELWNLSPTILVEFPSEEGSPNSTVRARNDRLADVRTESWVDEFLATGRGQHLSHLIAIERAGPSHTLESIAAQPRSGPAPSERFATEVPAAHRDVCHSMRGDSINGYTAKTHRLFECVGERKMPITTIGIGDGGNEIGMGVFAWELIVEAIGRGPASRIACRIATDFTLLAGVSNWAAYALALATVRLREANNLGRGWDARQERALIEAIVRQTEAVDGVTLRHEPTVDGLELDVCLAPLVEMRKLLRYGEQPEH